MSRNPKYRHDRDWRDSNGTADRVLSYETPKQLRRFRAGMVLMASTLVVAGLYAFAWYAVSSYVKAQVVSWADAQAAQGAIADFESMETTGFPSRIILTLTKPRYLGPISGRTMEWRGDALTLSTRPWMPWRLHAEAPGSHEMKWADGALSLGGEVARLSADIVAGDTWPERLTIDIEGVDLQGGATVSVDALRVDVRHDAQVQASGDGLTLHLSGANMTLPLGGGWGLGNTVESVDLAFRVTGPVQPGVLAERLTAWREVGGALELERLKLRAGPLGVAAVGTLALDEALQPIGAFTAKFEGLFQVLEILRGQGVVRDGDAVVATMALAALSKRPPGGGRSSINLAVGMQNGKFTLGNFPVLSMPTIDWGQAPSEPEVQEAPARDYKNIAPIY